MQIASRISRRGQQPTAGFSVRLSHQRDQQQHGEHAGAAARVRLQVVELQPAQLAAGAARDAAYTGGETGGEAAPVARAAHARRLTTSTMPVTTPAVPTQAKVPGWPPTAAAASPAPAARSRMAPTATRRRAATCGSRCLPNSP
ncbi:MAG: hypothetical protein R3F29_14350 [Planctomycetota bacterium]